MMTDKKKIGLEFEEDFDDVSDLLEDTLPNPTLLEYYRRLKKREIVGCEARACLSRIAVNTGSTVSSSAQSSSKYAAMVW